MSALRLPRVIRADGVQDGDETLDGDALSVSIQDNDEHVLGRAEQMLSAHVATNEEGNHEMIEGARPEEQVGDAPQLVTLKAGGNSVNLSPSDLIVVMR